MVENPDHLDLVNWIINQDYVGEAAPDGLGTYTYGDVQRAIWTLVEDGNSTSGLGAYSQARVDVIVAQATANGEGFVPGCGQFVAVILQPVEPGDAQVTIAQVTIAGVGVPCEFVNTATATGDYEGTIVTDQDTHTTQIVQPGIDIEKLTNGVNADTAAEAPQIAPGATVTWTYLVTNTGDVPFEFDEVVIVDDAGTPGDTSDDFSTGSGDIVLTASSDVGSDEILSPGEVWTYEASAPAEDLSGGAVGAPVAFDFTGNSPLDGEDGNLRTFSAGGVSVNASAFSRDKCTGAWSEAYLGSYGGGLGVTDSSEGGGYHNMHTVDNVYRDNYVLFEFSESVVVDSAFLGYVVNDSDLSVWIGTVPGAFTSHAPLSDAVLSGLEFTEVNLTSQYGTRTADLNAGQVAGNVLVIAAWTGDATPEDRFKIQNVTIQQADGGCYENYAVVTADGVSDDDLSHYCNPEGNVGIEIEKLTNGADADLAQGDDVPEIAPGDTVTWTYLVTNTGDVALDFDQVVVVDDHGTPGDAGDDFAPEFVESSDAGDDLVLSPGETWEYSAIGEAETLQVVIDFDDLDPGTIVNEQFQDVGLTITTSDSTSDSENHPAMIFDSSAPTGGDYDLQTPGYGANNDNALGNLLIISEDGDEDDPDDNAGGGTIIFEFDEAVRVNAIDLLDIDRCEIDGTVTTFDADGNVISTQAIADLGDNSFQSIAVGADGVSRMEVTLVSSGAVTELSFDRTYANVASVTVGATSDSDSSHYCNPPTPTDPTVAYKRFFVVDTYVDRTFEYDADGTPLENSHLACCNYAPRGITMTADGQTNWVVDKYNGVFVYDDDGNLLGRWDAGGLYRPEGIATDEEDIWIVDRSSDKVFFYDNAASRRSGSQDPSCAGSFHLADGNTNPRGITTDGETIWVVNDGRCYDKVFVYDTSGNLQGSWELSHNVKPRGITINPGDVNDIWIVDAYYDKVLEYQGGAFFTYGRHYPDARWRLACGNSKPEGIADPPPPSAPRLADPLAPSAALLPGSHLLSVFETPAGRLRGASEGETESVSDLAAGYWAERTAPTIGAHSSARPAPRAFPTASTALAADRAFSAIGDAWDDASDDVLLYGLVSDLDWLDDTEERDEEQHVADDEPALELMETTS